MRGAFDGLRVARWALAGVVVLQGCTTPATQVAQTFLSRADSAANRWAQQHEQPWRERHYPVVDLHGPYPRPALPDSEDVNDAIAYYKLGILVRDSAQGLADRAFSWAIRLEPYFPQAYYARWELLSRDWPWRLFPDSTVHHRGDAATRAADSLLFRAISYDPFVNEPLNFRRLTPYFSVPGRRQRDPFINGAEAYARGDYRKALDLWAQALRKESRALGLHIPRAYAWVRIGGPDSAVAELSAVVDRLETIERDSLIAPYIPKERFYYAIGTLRARQNDVAAARDAYQQALAENLGFYMVHARLAGIALTLSDTASALSSMETALLIEPNDLFVRAFYGGLLAETPRLEDAKRELEKVVRADSDYALPHLYLGRAYERSGDTATARRFFTAYLARAPRSAAERKWVEARMSKP